MSDVAADIFLRDLRNLTMTKGESIDLVLATGNSTKGLYERMVRRQDEFDATKLKVRNVDELILEPEHHHKSYAASLEETFSGLNPGFRKTKLIDASQISAWELEQEIKLNLGGLEETRSDGKEKGAAYSVSPNCKAETLKEVRRILNRHKYSIHDIWFTYTILGVGENGHIALHESGIPFMPFFQDIFLVKLDETTRRNLARDGYFSSIEKAPKYGITRDAQFIATSSLNMMVLASGARKSNAVEKALFEYGACKTPLSVIQYDICDSHSKAYLIVDEEAAKGILGRERALKEKGMRVQDNRQVYK